MSVSLLAFGRRGYAIATDNMVLSLRYHGYAGTIALYCTKAMEEMLSPETLEHTTRYYLNDDAKDPGLCKISLPNILMDEETLYLDVDGIVMKDITPLVLRLKQGGRHVMTQASPPHIVGTKERPKGNWWVLPATMAAKHDIEDGSNIYAVNTSAIWYRRGSVLTELADRMLLAHQKYQIRELVHKWGSAIPDELCFSAACAQMGLDPTMPERVCYFDRAPAKASQIADVAYVLPLYGSKRSNGCTSPHKLELYDGQIRQMRGRTAAAPYASKYVMAHKFIDQTR